MTQIFPLDAIKMALNEIDLTETIERAFVAYSNGEAVIPPVGELIFDKPPGDMHIKYGYIRGDEIYVVKIAAGFYDNPKKGLPPNDGLNLIFDASTGRTRAILLDEGYLTNLRTALAGGIAAKWLAPPDIQRIAILGTGLMARMQLRALARFTTCRRVVVWGRNTPSAIAYQNDMQQESFEVEIADDADRAVESADLIVTTTASTKPLFHADAVRPGAHITAMGSDTPEKQELPAGLFTRADWVAVDSRSQCVTRGEMHHVIKAGLFDDEKVIELGELISKAPPLVRRRGLMTIADLTGVAVQDIAVAQAALAQLETERCVSVNAN